jgi:hypothetical protein
MKARFNRVPLVLTLSLLSGLMGGCGLFGGGSGEANVQQSPQPVATQPFPSPAIPTASSPAKVALTRPTNPDDRLRVIKTGRNDPFGLLGPAISTGQGASNSSNGSTGSTAKSGGSTRSAPPKTVEDRLVNSYDKFLNNVASQIVKSPNKGTSRNISSSGGRNIGSSGSSSTMPNLGLPPLPTNPEPAKVKVSGIVVVAGIPRAIVEVPGETSSRTVGVGDSLSRGQLYVKSIDTSRKAEPVVIFQQGDLSFSVAVGRAPVLIASADPAGTGFTRSLHQVQPR